MAVTKQQRLAEVFVELADTLVADFDVIEFLAQLSRHCVDLLDAAAAGVLLADHNGRLRVAASSSEAARLIELFELQNDEGPSLDCYRTGKPVVNNGLDQSRWKMFIPEAAAVGFHTVQALPMRLRDEIIGVLNLFGAAHAQFDAMDIQVAQAMADIATIGILQQRSLRHAEVLAEQLQTALNSRVVIEQAKGVLAERGAIDMDEAFRRLRAYARNNQLKLAEVATGVVNDTVDIGQILAAGLSH